MSITLKTLSTLSSTEINDITTLYKDAGWWDDSYTTDFIPEMVKNSTIAIGVVHNNTLIGFGRAISDRVSDAYIQDVVVLSKFRGNGIGAKIISKIIDALHKKEIDWIGLIGEPGTENFYKRLGFATLENHIPMKFTENE